MYIAVSYRFALGKGLQWIKSALLLLILRCSFLDKTVKHPVFDLGILYSLSVYAFDV